MNDAVRRAIRTFLQGFVGMLVTTGIPAMQDMLRSASSGETYEFNYDLWQSIVISAVVGGIIALITWAQNELEDTGTVPALLKSPPSPGANPVPDDAGGP